MGRLPWSCYEILTGQGLPLLNLRIHMRTKENEVDCPIPSRGWFFESVTLETDCLWS